MDKRTQQYNQIGRAEAKRLYPIDRAMCVECDRPATDHHHVDSNTHNNTPANVILLCRRCHLRIERQALRVGSRTRLTRQQIDRIKSQESISQLVTEFGMCESYLRRIRSGEKNPRPVNGHESFQIPADWQWKERRGKKRVLTVIQVKAILSYKPTLGTVNAVNLSNKFSVNISTIWKARSRQGCYADTIYN